MGCMALSCLLVAMMNGSTVACVNSLYMWCRHGYASMVIYSYMDACIKNVRIMHCIDHMKQMTWY